MDSCNQNTVAVKFSTVKGCFLMVPEKWRKAFPAEPHVFKIQYGENKEKEAYMSCGKEVTHLKDVEHMVFMNEKYAEKLGIKEKEWIHLNPVTSATPKAERIILEPLTPDDWEIMELNAYFIEANLVNQIRVVWTDQVFPIWVKNSVLYAKVVDCLPAHNPVILCEYSLVNVVPKDRYKSSSTFQRDSDSLKQKSKSNYLHFEHLRYSKHTDETFASNDHDDESDYSSKFPSSDGSSITSYYAQSFLASWFSYPREDKSLLSEQFQEESETFFQPNFDCVLRVLPYTNPRNSLPSVVQTTTVFINVNTYVACCGDQEIPPCFVAILRKFPLPERKQKKNVNDNVKNGNFENVPVAKNDSKSLKDSEQDEVGVFDSVYVTVMVMKSAEEDEFILPLNLFTYKNAIIVPKELKRGFNLQVASLIHLKSVDKPPLPAFGITLHPVNDLDKHIDQQTVQEQFIQWAFGKRRSNPTFVISDGTLVKLKINVKKYDFFIHIQEKEYSSRSSNHSGSFNSLDSDKSVSWTKGETNYGFLSFKVMKRTSVKIGQRMGITITTDRPYLSKDNGLYHDINTVKLSDLGGVKELSSKAIKDIEFWLKLRPLSYISNHSSTYCGCILICGPKGVGKSAFASAICKKFINYPYHVFVKSIQCLPLKGRRGETIAKMWDDIISEAIYSQPSLILFEDLDYIASSPTSHEQENGPDGIYFAGISQAFIHMMNRIIASESKVTIIATSQSLHSLHSSLVNTRGRHIFQSIVEVNPPNGEQREQILHAMISEKTHVSSKTLRKVKLSDIAAKTEGYVAQDLGTLVDRATHAAWVRLVSSDKADQITLEKEDFEAALKSFVPASLRGIALQIQDQRTWNDVGGLKQVKKVIQQIIMWPTKYKQIYKNYSLKPQTNILLYGAPGTGKTMLAGVVANECGLNFISIKGPELLSKYIGASEQAVRDLFKRATTARPCILFFDEFDSIAPRRGHDSTGVTDRVVNQLLTQLDGVESLEGVHVLAATSRPGLIDPALLRPGRLDKCLLCPLPDKEDRKEILECLSAKLPLSNDIDFGSIASLTENFSGADLQAVLYTAHIEALHDVEHFSTRRYSTSSDDKDYSLASDKLLYMPTVEEGLKTPSYEDGKKIIQEAAVVQDRYFGKSERPSSKRNSLNVFISQRHLLKVASEMNPSVSPEERLRYEMIFRKFQNVLSGEPSALTVGNIKRVTLA